MRSKKQKLYDDFYYNFERWLVVRFEDARARRRVRGKKFSPEFYEAYRNVIRPYWKKFGVRIKLFRVKDNYLITNDPDPRYIPGDLYVRRIIPHFNPLEFVTTLTDKNLNSLLYPDAKRPETIFKHMTGSFCREDFTPLAREDAFSLLREGEDYVVKPTRDSSEGMDVKFFTGPGGAETLLPRYESIDYIVQRAVRQHPDLAALNESSVNTIRLVTLKFRGEVHLLSSILRVGAPGHQVDNIGAGGYQCVIRPDGTLRKDAYTPTPQGFTFVEDNSRGVRFEGYPVPSFEKARDLALDLAARTPHLRLIAWDIAVDEAGDPVLIEFNAAMPGQNQSTCGPTFGDLTDDVLTEVFGRK